MSKLNVGPTMARTEVSVITLFGILFFASVLLVQALPCGATSTGASPSEPTKATRPSLRDVLASCGGIHSLVQGIILHAFGV